MKRVLADVSTESFLQEERTGWVQGGDPPHPQPELGQTLTSKPAGVTAETVANTVVTLLRPANLDKYRQTVEDEGSIDLVDVADDPGDGRPGVPCVS